jgi:hypothetical protein
MGCAALGLVPFWWHVDLVDPGVQGIIAVFAGVAVYPSDVCLLVLAVLAVRRPPRLTPATRWLVIGFALLAAAALLSGLSALDPFLAAGLAGHLGLLGLAWLGLRTSQVPRIALVGALVASATVQSVLAVGQFIAQQPIVPSVLQLPWLPDDVSQGGAPVVLSAAGTRLLRGFGTFPHPNVLGGYLAMALVCVPLLGRRWPRMTRAWWALGAVIGLGLVASFSRAGWLAAIGGLGVWWWSSPHQRRSRWWLLASVAAVLVVLALSPFGPTMAGRLAALEPDSNPLERGSVETRLALDYQAPYEIIDHLPLGVGGGNYGLVTVAEGRQEGWGQPAPNVALLVAAELGAPGVLALVVVVLATGRSLRSGRSGLDVPATAACLALVILAMLDHYLWTMPPGRVIGWVPFALIAATSQLESAQNGL